MEWGLDVFSDQSGIVSQRRLDFLVWLLGDVSEYFIVEICEVDVYMGHLFTRYFVVTDGDVIVEHITI